MVRVHLCPPLTHSLGFNSLKLAENRRIEPWVCAALSYLNHPLRQQEALAYLNPALEMIKEIQRTGDIFFPRNWSRTLLTGHTSLEAKEIVKSFFNESPELPPMLKNKILQQTDHLYRIHTPR